MIFVSCHITPDKRFAGNHLVALVLEDIGKQHRRALACVVDVRLEAHAKHRNLCPGLDVAPDALGDPRRLSVVDCPRLVNERRNVLKFFMDEPRVDRDTVPAHADARRMHVDSRMAVCQLNQIKHIDAQPVADLAQLVGVGDVDVAERVFCQLAHLCR